MRAGGVARAIDATALLEGALVASAKGQGVVLAVARSDARRWASATFTGARHVLTVGGAAHVAADAWLDGLRDAEFALRGHLVADLAVIHRARDAAGFTATVEVLTLEER